MGLFPRLMLGAVLSVGAVVGLFGWRLDVRSRRSYIADRGATLTNRAAWTAELFRAEVAELRRDAGLAARVPAVVALAESRNAGEHRARLTAVRPLFTAFLDASPDLKRMLLVSFADSGRVLLELRRTRDSVIEVASFPARLDVYRDAFVSTRVRGRDAVFLSPIERRAEDGDTLRVIRAALAVTGGDGRALGFVLIERDLGPWIDRTLDQPPPGVTAHLADALGTGLERTADSLAWLLEDLPPAGGPPEWVELSRNHEVQHVARLRLALDPPATEPSAVVAFVLSEPAVTARLAPVHFATIVGSVSVAVTLIAGSVLILAWALRPLRQFRMVAERIGAGEYDTPLPAAAGGELGAFAAAFQSMVSGLRARDDENRRTTAALRDSEARFRETLEDMQEGCQIIGFDWRYLYVNESAARHGRRAANELLGRTMMEAYPGIDDTPMFEALRRCMTLREPQQLENEFRYQDGTVAWFDLTVHPAREGLFITSYDITARKAAELEQRAASARIVRQLEHLTLLDQVTRSIAERHDLQSIYQTVVSSIETDLLLDAAAALIHDPVANRFEVAAVGPRAAEAVPDLREGTSIAVDNNGLSRVATGVLVYERDIAELDAPFTRRLSAAGCRSLVLAPMRSESRVFGAIVAARRAPDAFSSTECEFLRQATEHVALGARQAQLHAALQSAYDDLRQSQQAAMQLERLRAMSQMASGIAHDINNALSPVSLYTEVLLSQEPDLSPRTREFLEHIRASVQQVADTVSRMREFARPGEAGRTPVPLRVNDLVKKAIAFTHARWADIAQRQGSTIEPVLDLEEGLPEIAGVESELRDALTNLIFNAVDAMPRGGTITFRTRQQPAPATGRGRPRVVVEVSDTGTGMDEETRLRCIEPFYTTKGERGTGLGLAMVFGMMQRHGGRLEVDSTLGAGTTVRLAFPVALAPTALAGPAAVPGAARSGLRILLIDDDPVLLKSLEATMNLDGHASTIAAGGEIGLSAFRRALEAGAPYDVVITDLGMPKVDGRQVAATVKALSPATPVLLLTGWGRRLLEDHEVPPHVDQVLSKPPTLEDLRAALAATDARTDPA